MKEFLFALVVIGIYPFTNGLKIYKGEPKVRQSKILASIFFAPIFTPGVGAAKYLQFYNSTH